MICKEIRASGHYSHSMVATGLGLNVIMPNLSPEQVRKKYELYNNKICTGAEAA